MTASDDNGESPQPPSKREVTSRKIHSAYSIGGWGCLSILLMTILGGIGGFLIMERTGFGIARNGVAWLPFALAAVGFATVYAAAAQVNKQRAGKSMDMFDVEIHPLVAHEDVRISIALSLRKTALLKQMMVNLDVTQVHPTTRNNTPTRINLGRASEKIEIGRELIAGERFTTTVTLPFDHARHPDSIYNGLDQIHWDVMVNPYFENNAKMGGLLYQAQLDVQTR